MYKHLCTWLSGRGKSKLPNEHPLEHFFEATGNHKAFSFFSSTVWVSLRVERVLPFSILRQIKFHVSRSGVRTPVKAIFSDVPSMTTHINQSIDKVNQKTFSIDWPLQKVGRRIKSEKKILTGIRTPDLETWSFQPIGTPCAVPVPVPHQIPRFQVWGSNPSQGNSTFPGLGFEPQSRQFFRFSSFFQLSATVNQWRIFFVMTLSIDWLID